MKWSAFDVALVPPGPVTLTSTVPFAWAGLVAVIWVSESTVKLVAAVAPKSTAVALQNPDPVIVTVVPPVFGPNRGDTPVTTGGEP